MTPPFVSSLRPKLVRFLRSRWSLVVLVFALGWMGASLSKRELTIGVGPQGTSFRQISLEVATEISNHVRGARFVFCPAKGTEDALERLGKSRMPIVDRLFHQDCREHLDLAAITDGTGSSTEGVVLLTPLFKSYLQFVARKDRNIPDIATLLDQAPNLRLGVSTRELATYSRACLALHEARRSNLEGCEGDLAYERMGFSSVTKDDNLGQLVKQLLDGRLDVVIFGGPVCPRGSAELGKSTDVAPIPWSVETSPLETQVYPCLGNTLVKSPYSWTWLAAAEGLDLSTPEIHGILTGLNALPGRFRETSFANFDSLPGWPGFPKRGTSTLAYSPMMKEYYDLSRIDSTSRDKWTLAGFATEHQIAIQFIGALLAIAVSIVQLITWRAKHRTT